MSADPSPPSSPTEIVKETTEKSASFLQWVAELIRRRNWFTLLLLIDVALILFCSPGGVVAQFLKSAFSLDLSQQFPSYGSYFWPVVGLIPVIALVMASWCWPCTPSLPAIAIADLASYQSLVLGRGVELFMFLK